MDSEPPITAALAAQAIGGRGLDMIHRVQRAHYEEGRRIADAPVLRELAVDLGLPADVFDAECARQSGALTQQHIAASRRLLDRVGGQGYPTFVLEDGEGRMDVVDAGAWLGRPEAWAQALAQHLAAGTATPAAAGVHEAAPACGPDSCALPGTSA